MCLHPQPRLQMIQITPSHGSGSKSTTNSWSSLPSFRIGAKATAAQKGLSQQQIQTLGRQRLSRATLDLNAFTSKKHTKPLSANQLVHTTCVSPFSFSIFSTLLTLKLSFNPSWCSSSKLFSLPQQYQPLCPHRSSPLPSPFKCQQG